MFRLGQVRHHFHEVAHHFFANPPDQGASFFRNANHHLPAVLPRAGTHHITKILQPIDKPARGRGGVPHLLRDRGHGEDFFLGQTREQEKLRERNVTRSQLLAETQDETALHFQDDVREAFGIGPKLIESIEPQLRGRIQTA